jgi:hypothetical protein
MGWRYRKMRTYDKWEDASKEINKKNHADKY